MSVSYTPAPFEQAYYDGLFQTADVRRAGTLGGAEAVGFFSRSKLPMEMLKNIWTVADQNPTTSSLDKRKFCTAVRLIQLSQNGTKAQGANLAAPPGVTLRPVFFEGVSGMVVPMPLQAPQQPPMRSATPPMVPQQQAPLSPQRPPPPTPPRHPPVMMQQAPQAFNMSMALTVQDPYSLPPQDQARYESLFPQYAKEDGYVYGSEAVALFSKSGLSSEQLRDIWNMVDYHPVDNRLDILEFCIAMHLIVCVSKKNLPMPPSGLPFSLRAMKSQQAAAATPMMPSMTTNPQQQQPPMMAPPQQQQPPMMAPPQQSPMMAPQAQQQSSIMSSNASVGSGGPPPPPQVIRSTPPAYIHAPPPLPQQQPAAGFGGMNISDAFEGLSGGGMGMGGPSQGFTSLPDPGSLASVSSFDQIDTAPTEETIPEPAAPVVMMEKPKSTKELASSYQMGDDSTELAKLKNQLQKLQAENVSLKAALGSMTVEEREVQKEISATVAEIGKLSGQLTTLRAQVLAGKSKLLEATAELKGHKEKKGMIADLITETQATKDAIDTALNGVHEAEMISEEHEAQANIPPQSYEADLFGFDSPAPAPAPSLPKPTMRSFPEQTKPRPPPVQITVSDATTEGDDDNSFGNGHASAAFASADFANFEENGATSGPAVAAFSGASPAMSHDEAFDDGDLAAPSDTTSPTAADVERLKERARLADQTAQEAEESRRGLTQQADDLRKIADQAEEDARSKEAAMSKKRGPGFGRKKKEMKELEKAKQDAAEKKKQFMDVLTQANNAQALALETRREAEQLQQAAEQAEIEAVQAASLQHSQPAHFRAPAASIAAASAPMPGFGMHEKQPSYGGFGDGFGIMGGAVGDGGGFSIPSPSGSVNGGDHPFVN